MSAKSHIRSKRQVVSRRTFLTTAGIAVGVACAAPYVRTSKARRFTGGIVGANSALGHALRDEKFPASSETAEAGVVIVGGGIGGLAAARRLQRSSFNDFVLL